MGQSSDTGPNGPSKQQTTVKPTGSGALDRDVHQRYVDDAVSALAAEGKTLQTVGSLIQEVLDEHGAFPLATLATRLRAETEHAAAALGRAQALTARLDTLALLEDD